MSIALPSSKAVNSFMAIGTRKSDDTEERDVVEICMVIGVTGLPAGIVADGKKVAFAPVGRPVAANVMEVEYVPFEGANTRLKGAGWPAVTVSEVVWVFTA